MRKRPHLLILFLAVVTGLVAGVVLQALSVTALSEAQVQSETARDNKILVRGHGSATTSKRPTGEPFIFYTSSESFRAVPPGKTFIMTDMFYNTRQVKQNLTVNLAKAILRTQKPDQPFKANILQQIDFRPDESRETHLCSGYEIDAGNGVSAWTNAGLEPDQTVQIVVTGYLIDQVK
ncbi:MAG TPA: hypothetical protein VM911_03635 [Pyrinomonadaceae bacterium]|jgi:hypothetical protein|nr:hypothetical protein [Pyrinomonadaceae bacterium]